MGNYYFFVTKKYPYNLGLEALIPKLAADLFQGNLRVEGTGVNFDIYQTVGDQKWPLYRIDWLHGRRTGGKHGGLGWVGWTQTILMESIALAVGGHMGDEGVIERWKPNPEKYPTYRSWFEETNEEMLGHAPEVMERDYNKAPEWARNLTLVFPPRVPLVPQISRFELMRET